jgi:hypothetical protein
MKKRSVFPMLTIACAVCLFFLGMSAPAAAQSTCSPTNVTALDGGLYDFQMNE